jgi:hypothetical protein
MPLEIPGEVWRGKEPSYEVDEAPVRRRRCVAALARFPHRAIEHHFR